MWSCSKSLELIYYEGLQMSTIAVITDWFVSTFWIFNGHPHAYKRISILPMKKTYWYCIQRCKRDFSPQDFEKQFSDANYFKKFRKLLFNRMSLKSSRSTFHVFVTSYANLNAPLSPIVDGKQKNMTSTMLGSAKIEYLDWNRILFQNRLVSKCLISIATGLFCRGVN